MKKILLTVLAASALILASTALHAQQMVVEKQTDYIEVSARAYRDVSPDEINIKIVLDENDTKGKMTINQLEQAMFAAVKKAGIDTKNVTLADAAAGVKTYVLWKNQSRTRKDYLVKTDVSTLSALYKALDDNGIYNIAIASTRITKLEQITDSLRIEAIQKAKERATMLAGAIGQTVKEAILINSYDNNVYDAVPMYTARTKSLNAAMVEETPDVEFRTTKVEVNISARFRLYP